MNWEGKVDKVHQLFSKAPHYNKVGVSLYLQSGTCIWICLNFSMGFQISKQYELDFRDKGKAGLKIQRSVKNFQLTLEVC